MHIGVDVGGTFTDLVTSADGTLKIYKLSSTPADPSEAMLAGVMALSRGMLDTVERVSHGSTVATNAILERKGARTALVTTLGFRDLLTIGRQHRPVLYALYPTLPPPLIPRELCWEIPERLDAAGQVLLPLDIDALDHVLDEMEAAQVESVAVCLLHSYVNPQHEQQVRTRIVERGHFAVEQVALSSEVLPEFREYERASTVALEAYVRPVMSRYLRRLQGALPERCGLWVMKSDGGVMSAGAAATQAIQTALSGPAAGVVGAYRIAHQAGFDRVITLDMGGTSTDVALCPGELVRRPESTIDGLPLRIRLLDIETVGAGGGSIAYLDSGAILRVGPESAGADPGPAAYGRGGELPTVTDANVVLERLHPEHFLGGAMTLDTAAARTVLSRLAVQMGTGVEKAAAGVLEVATAQIDRAIRRVSVARGYDPRDFTLVAFGGAGPLHACAVAARLEISRILIPRYPGVLCALGLLMADVVLDYSQSVLAPLTEAALGLLTTHLGKMRARAIDDLRRETESGSEVQTTATADMRYRGQAYELPVRCDEAVSAQGLAARFHEAHQQAFGYMLPERPVEIVNCRLQVTATTTKPAFTAEALDGIDGAEALLGHRVTVDGVRMALYERERLTPGSCFDGAALIFQMDSTVYLPPGWIARVDGYRNLILETSGG